MVRGTGAQATVAGSRPGRVCLVSAHSARLPPRQAGGVRAAVAVVVVVVLLLLVLLRVCVGGASSRTTSRRIEFSEGPWIEAMGAIEEM